MPRGKALARGVGGPLRAAVCGLAVLGAVLGALPGPAWTVRAVWTAATGVGGVPAMALDASGSGAGRVTPARKAADVASFARQPTRASRLNADAYGLQGRRVTGGRRAAGAPALSPGQYVDDIGPGETRWYAVDLDAASTADLAVTAVPRPGARAAYGDGVELRLAGTGRYPLTCGADSAHFGQDEGAMVVVGAVSRIPSDDRGGACDEAGRYVLSVHRTSAAGSDLARWPLELRYGIERPFAAGATPAPAATRYGDPPAALTGPPRDVEGGTGSTTRADSAGASGGTRCCPGRRASTRCGSAGGSGWRISPTSPTNPAWRKVPRPPPSWRRPPTDRDGSRWATRPGPCSAAAIAGSRCPWGSARCP